MKHADVAVNASKSDKTSLLFYVCTKEEQLLAAKEERIGLVFFYFLSDCKHNIADQEKKLSIEEGSTCRGPIGTDQCIILIANFCKYIESAKCLNNGDIFKHYIYHGGD